MMEKYKTLLGPTEARNAIKEGVRRATELVAPTLGVRGRKIVLDKEFATMEVVDDGYMILQEVELENTHEQLGVKMLREAVTKTNDKVGDGTTTNTVLANALVQEVVQDEDPTDLLSVPGNVLRTKNELRDAVEKVIKYIDKNKVKVSDAQIADIAAIACNDEYIGEILAKLFKRLGKDAAILVNDSLNIKTDYELVEGLKFDRGFASPAMVTDGERGESVIRDANVLVIDGALQNPQDIPVLIKLFKDHGVNDFVVVAKEISGLPLDFLIRNKLTGALRTLGVEAPMHADATEYLKDVAAFTGATMVSKENNLKLKDVTPEHLGHASRIVATQDTTTVVGGKAKKKELRERLTLLNKQLKDRKMKFDKDRLKERISKLRGGVGIIKVGGSTEMEVEEKKAKIDDAVHAVRAALEDGAVPGGGVTLLRAAAGLSGKTEGERILMKSIVKPFNQILENADYDAEVVRANVLSNANKNYGLNIATGNYCDLVKTGIMDPSLVTKTALRTAMSIALLVLTTSGAVALIRKKDDGHVDNAGASM
jgi:chaperonin GroEL